MYIGEQLSDLSDRKLTWAAQLGVEHIAVNTLRDTGIQNEDGSWKNSSERWLEADPNLVTAYSLLALAYCEPKAVAQP